MKALQILNLITEEDDEEVIYDRGSLETAFNSPMDAYRYASSRSYEIYRKTGVSHNRFLEGEHLIASDPETAVLYARGFIRGRWPEAEPTIIKDASWSIEYAKHVIKGRWPEAEPTILAAHPMLMYLYAHNLIKGRWPEAENAIATDPSSLLDYIIDTVKSRVPELEDKLKKYPRYWEKYYDWMLFHHKSWLFPS